MQQTPTSEALENWRSRLACGFPAVQAVFADCMEEAVRTLSMPGIDAYLECASALGKMGRGPEPVLAFLQEWPQAAQSVGEDALADVSALLHRLQKSPNSAAMVPLLQTLAAVARRLQGGDPLRHYLGVVQSMMERTTVSLHGHYTPFASPGLLVLLEHAPRLLGVLTVAGLSRWAEYGARHYQHQPEQQRAYFSLQSADSRAVLQRQRHGTLLVDVERQLDLVHRALWRAHAPLHAYATGLGESPFHAPWSTHHTQDDSLCVPDVYDDLNSVSGLDRYRVALAHLAAHRRWSQPLVADNLSPLQRLTVECLEDARMDHLLLRQCPGLRGLLLALHPRPIESACDPAVASCARHRLALLSRALLDPDHGYGDADLNACVAAFQAELAHGESNSQAMRTLAVAYAARTRRQSDQMARVFFDNTVISYRDDNRHLWVFLEAGDEEDTFEQPRSAPAPQATRLPPRHYPEWDHASQSLRPDWVSVYEALHPGGNASVIDALLHQHAGLARQLERLLDLLKPHDRTRIRYQEDGSELDLDAAVRALTDWRAGAQPDPRILMSHNTIGRSISVLVLMDVSQSLNDPVAGTGQTRLELSQQAVALLAWAMDRLGDPFALACFHSNTRHDVRYQHIKGFGEHWDATPKARLAALHAAYSTRMGAALRHGSHSLERQASDKKLLLLLTDGRPSDVDVSDEWALVADTRVAVQELAHRGIHSHCISLDPQADTYVHSIFGQHATVIDQVEQLPERLTKLFLSLTR